MPPEVVTDWEERLQEMNPQAQQLWSTIPLPERLPAYEQIILDKGGNLWVAEYLVLEETPIWQVFNPQGVWLGAVVFPPGGRISEIGDDYILGIWRDDMGVQRIKMYGLNKWTGN